MKSGDLVGSRQAVIDEFASHSFHDDRVVAVRVLPAATRRSRTTVEVDLLDSDSGRMRRLVLKRCANMNAQVDFDVVHDNAPFNVDAVTVVADDDAIRALIGAQAPALNVEYFDQHEQAHEQVDRQAKLDDPSGLLLFRVALFGGTLEVAAVGFKVTRVASARRHPTMASS